MTLLAVVLTTLGCSQDAIPTAPAGPEQNRLVAQVIVTPGDALLQPDDSQGLSVVVKGARGQTVNGRAVTWRSLDESVVEVDANGRLLAVNEGSAKVEASVEGVRGTATVDVRGEVVKIEIDPPAQLAEGEKAGVGATYVYSNGARRPAGRLAWRSEDRSVAVVDADGEVTGRGTGTTILEARGRGRSGNTLISVSDLPVKSVVVHSSTSSLTVGEQVEFWAEIFGPGNKRLTGEVTWSTSNAAVASVDRSTGLVTGEGTGTATIRASVEGVSGSASVTVTAPGSTTTTSVSSPAAVADLRVTGVGENSIDLTFTQVDDGTGDPADYVVRYLDGSMSGQWEQALNVVKGSCALPVGGSAIGASLTCSVDALHAGTRYEFQVAAFREENGSEVFGPLSSIVSGTTSDPTLHVDVIPSSFHLDVDDTKQLQASVLDSYGNVVSQSVSWTSTSSGVASVNGSGLVTGMSAGDATIRATYQQIDDGSDVTVVRLVSETDDGSDGGSGSSSGSSSGTPSGSVQPGPNEPSGFTTVVDGTCDGNMSAEGWGWNSGRHPTDEAGFPNSPTCRVHYPQGYANDGVMPGTSGHSNGTNYWNVGGFDSSEMYATALVKFSSSWVNSGGGLKIMGLMRDPNMASGCQQSGRKQFVWITGNGGYTSGTKGEMSLGASQKEMTSCQPAVSRELRSGTAGRFRLGQVHRVEAYARINSAPGVPDGILRLWLDGNLVAERTNVVWYTDSAWTARTFTGIKWFPSIGGRSDGNDPAQDFWIDDFYVSTP